MFEENGFSDLSDPECDDDESTEKAGSRRASRKESNPRRRSSNQNSNASSNNKKNNNNDAGNSNATNIDDDKDKDTKEEPTDMPAETSDDGLNVISNVSSPNTSSYETVGNDFGDFNLQTPVQEPMPDFVAVDEPLHPVIITNASIDIYNMSNSPEPNQQQGGAGGDTNADGTNGTATGQTLGPSEPKSNCVSPASSNGGIYSVSSYCCLNNLHVGIYLFSYYRVE